MTTPSTTTNPALEPCPWCPTTRRETYNTEGGVVGVIIHEPGCFFDSFFPVERRQVLTPRGVQKWNSRVTAPIVAPVVNFEAWTSIDAWLRDNPIATAAECLAELVKRIKVEATPASTVAPVEQSGRSNHFDNAAIDKGTFPDHISSDGRAYYADGTILRPADDAAPASPAALRDEAAYDDWVAWLRYDYTNEETTGTTIHVCDSDAKGAFKVYRAPLSPATTTTPPSTLAKAAAEEIRKYVLLNAHKLDTEIIKAIIIERCFSADSEDQKSTPTGL